jgi:hypothetical protein
MLKLLPIFLVLITLSGTAYAQVEVKQSVTTDTNGQSTSINSSNCLGLPSASDRYSIDLPLHGGKVNLTETPGAVTIHYCKEKCHTYRIADNGTIRKVN